MALILMSPSIVMNDGTELLEDTYILITEFRYKYVGFGRSNMEIHYSFYLTYDDRMDDDVIPIFNGIARLTEGVTNIYLNLHLLNQSNNNFLKQSYEYLKTLFPEEADIEEVADPNEVHIYE